jgi:hypothetical protein
MKALFGWNRLALACTLGGAVMTSASADQVYVASYQDGTIQRYDTSGNWLGTFASVGGPGPMSLAWSNNDLYVADYNTSQILEYSDSGAYLGVFATTISNPKYLMFDNSGDMFVSTLFGPGSDAMIQEFSPSGALLNTIDSGGIRVDQMNIGPNGNLFVADFINSDIEEFSLNGTAEGLFTDTSIAPGLESEGSIAFDSAGDAFTGNTFSSEFYKLDSAGQIVSSWSNPDQPGQAGGALADFTFGPGDILYAVDTASNNIWMYDTSGNSLGLFTGSHLDAPYQIAFGPNATSTPAPAALASFGLGVLGVLRRRSARRRSQK